MNRDSFVSLFLERVAEPAIAQGYRFVGGSQTLAYCAGDATVALIRLGGKWAAPGSIAHILCARHRFLRTLIAEAVPEADTLSVSDYPYKWRPSSLFGIPPNQWRYSPSNLGHWEHDRLEYGEQDERTTREAVDRLLQLLVKPATEWAAMLSPERGLADLQHLGEGAWCERLWIEDYEARLANSGRAVQQ